MSGPIDYSIPNAVDPSQAFMQALNAGRADVQYRLQQQQQQAAMAQQLQMQQDLARLASNPNATGADYSRVMTMYPQLSEHLKRAADTLNTEQQQAELKHGSQVFAALSSNRPDIAAVTLEQRAQALDNSGDKVGAAVLRSQAKQLETDPAKVRNYYGLSLSQLPGGEKVINSATALNTDAREQEVQPVKMAQERAAATEAGVKAAVAVATAPAAVAKSVLENLKLQEDTVSVAAARRIAELNVQIAQSNSETERGRLTLERDKFIQEQAKTQQAQGQAAQDAQNQSTAALQTVNDIKTHRGMDAYWTAPGTKWGAIWRVVPGSDRQALETSIDALKGQLGYSNLMAAKASSPTGASGFGALSDSELKLLSSLAGNLDPNSADFPVQLAKVERYLQKAQSTATARPGLPNKGEAYVATLPRGTVVTEGDINAAMRKYPGTTREQVLMYLQQQGAK